MTPFIRTAFNRVGVVDSMCLRCGRVIATSPNKEALKIAEEAHVCETNSLPSAAIASAKGKP